MTDQHVPLATPDSREELLQQLHDLVPTAFKDGELDTASLLDALGATEPNKPAFTFSWPGIERARRDARSSTTATLLPDEDTSINWSQARDVLIEGDNLQVLKLMRNGYSEQAKLIYIDPPYNTGETFTYNDNFAAPEAEYLRNSQQVDEQGNSLTSKIETAGKKHAPWLTMMFSRLAVARHLLRRDGFILISIDDNEVHHLRLLMDAIFGAKNFVDMMTWKGARKGDAKLTGGGHDYILIYARDKKYVTDLDLRWREKKTGLSPIYAKVDELLEIHKDDYEAASTSLREWYSSLPEEDPSKAHSHYRVIDERGVYFPGDISSPNPRPNMMYDWKGYSIPENGWRYEQKTMEKLDSEGRLLYPDSKDKRIQVKRYLKEHEDWAPPSVFYKDRRSAGSQIKDLLGARVFDSPKNTDVLARLFHSMTDEGDLIVDFFAGSGSTGHAVWEANNMDGKTRHWVLVQIPEKITPTNKTSKAAIKAGYDNVFDITAARLRKSGESLCGTSTIGMRIFRARTSNLIIETPIIASDDMNGAAYVQLSLDRLTGPPVVEGADSLAVAWEVVLKSTSTRLDARVAQHDVDGVCVYEFAATDEGESGAGRLLVSLDAFDLSTADALGLTNDDTLILRGDRVSDATTLTLAPRLQSKLVMLERTPREVSL